MCRLRTPGEEGETFTSPLQPDGGMIRLRRVDCPT